MAEELEVILERAPLNIKERAEQILCTFALELFHSGVKLIPEYHKLLVQYNLIDTNTKPKVSNYEIDQIRSQYSGKYHLVNESAIAEELRMIKARGYEAEDFEKVTRTRKLRDNITKSEWLVYQLKPDREFISWINSINTGWQNKIYNDKFNLYKEQALYWKHQNFSFPEYGTLEEKKTFVSEERKRCLQNSVYAVTKYGVIPDTFHIEGEIRFNCWDVQCFLLYLFDCGLSFILGKPRQIGSTTVLAIAAEFRTMIRKNYFTLLVAQKGKKSEEIFEEKVKFPVNHFPHYIKPSISNWNGMEVVFQYRGPKGSSLPYASKFRIDAPAADVVNAGSPSLVLLDEIGLNDKLEEIILQGRPTIFRVNPETGELEMRRQLIGWGTADSVSEAFEYEFKSALENWAEENFRYGLIPIFINCFAKPGFTIKHYEDEKVAYYSRKKKVGKPDPKVLFHQTYPLYMEDMFISSDDTVVPMHIINKQYEKTLASKEHREKKRGYFEPVYDTTVATPNTDVPYKIVGARFVPAQESDIEEDNEFACIHLIHDYEPMLHTFYSGIDPIFSTSGHSKMSNAIWDSNHKRLSAYMNFKASDYRYCYLQAMLLNLYYSRQVEGKATCAKELVEINMGGEYINYVSDKGFKSSLTRNDVLPDNLQTTTIDVGIRKNSNSKFIVNKLEELIQAYPDGINSVDFWLQLKTFVKKQTETGEKFEPKNKKTDWDDLIDGVVYSFINAQSNSIHKPVSIVDALRSKTAKKSKMVYKYIPGRGTVLVSANETLRNRMENSNLMR